MRLFVALEVPDEVRRAVDAAVAGYRADHPGLRWTRPDGWHLTLAFLGDVAQDHVPGAPAGLRRALAEAATSAPSVIRLRLGDPGRFGTRVLWLAVHDEPDGAVAGLGERLQAAAVDAGVDVDGRPVRPHITLARARGRDVRISQAIVAACPTVEGVWDGHRAVLVRSHLGGGSARYEQVAAFELG